MFVGFPNWLGTVVPPVASFLNALDFSGKRIIPFITHGGGGMDHMVTDIRKLCQTADVDDGFDANRSEQIPAIIKAFKL